MKTSSFMMGGRRGFTLIELLVVLVIVGILAGLAFSLSSALRDRANIAKCTGNLRAMASGTIAWASERDGLLWTGEDLGYSRYRMVDDPLGPPYILRDYVPKTAWLCPAGYKECVIFGNNYTWNFKWNTKLPEPRLQFLENIHTTPLYWDAYQMSLPSMYNAFEPVNTGTIPTGLKVQYQVKPHYSKKKHHIAYLDGHVVAP